MRSVHSCAVLSPRQLTFLAERLPERPLARTGRPAYTNRDLLPGSLRMLRSGFPWRDLDRPGYPSGVMLWRRYNGYTRFTWYVHGPEIDWLIQSSMTPLAGE